MKSKRVTATLSSLAKKHDEEGCCKNSRWRAVSCDYHPNLVASLGQIVWKQTVSHQYVNVRPRQAGDQARGFELARIGHDDDGSSTCTSHLFEINLKRIKVQAATASAERSHRNDQKIWVQLIGESQCAGTGDCHVAAAQRAAWQHHCVPLTALCYRSGHFQRWRANRQSPAFTQGFGNETSRAAVVKNDAGPIGQ